MDNTISENTKKVGFKFSWFQKLFRGKSEVFR